jgi:carboxypeptidase Taq
MAQESDYGQFLKLYKEISTLGAANSILQWDMETKMPAKGINKRANQMSLLSVLAHQKFTNPALGSLINKIKASPDYNANAVMKRNIEVFEKVYTKVSKLPGEFVAELSKQRGLAVDAWKKAKAKRDYSMFKDHLKKNIELATRKAKYINPDAPVYDVLLDDFEPKMPEKTISPLFEELKSRLVPLVKKCVDSSDKPDISFINRKVPVSVQEQLGYKLTEFIGLDSQAFRLDTTEHPFTMGGYGDVRITTHYYEDKVISSLYSVLHEGGHALYCLNLDPEWEDTPIGDACSYGIHESQSRMMENIIGRSYEFWEYFYPIFKELTNPVFNDISCEDFWRAVNYVKPSKIRIEADEVTYSLHIILRFEMEREIFNGKHTIDELPHVWNEKVKEMFGIEIQNDSEGIMQDTHWASGSFGYFPSYALGNIYGAQQFHKLREDVPNVNDAIRSGDITPVRQWLKENIHRKSNMYDPDVLMKSITGERLKVNDFIEYLEDKCKKVYRF